MVLFNVALAETAETASDAVAKVAEAAGISEEAASGAIAGAITGAMVGAAAALIIIWFILQVIADWKIFTKAGEAGWKSIIPIYNYYVEYGICWVPTNGLAYAVAIYVANIVSTVPDASPLLMVLSIVLGVLAIILHIKESLYLAKAFGKGTGFGVCLILFGPIARMVLGFGKAEYMGNPNK